MCPLDDVTAKSSPKYFWIVFALAGDSTMTRLVALEFPLMTGLPALRALPLVLLVLLRRVVFLLVGVFVFFAVVLVVRGGIAAKTVRR